MGDGHELLRHRPAAVGVAACEQRHQERPARQARRLIVGVVGAVALEVAETDGRAPIAAEADRIAGRRSAMAAIPAAVLPRTAAAADTIAAWVGTEQFDWMLERVLDGLLGRLPNGARAWRSAAPPRAAQPGARTALRTPQRPVASQPA